MNDLELGLRCPVPLLTDLLWPLLLDLVGVVAEFDDEPGWNAGATVLADFGCRILCFLVGVMSVADRGSERCEVTLALDGSLCFAT